MKCEVGDILQMIGEAGNIYSVVVGVDKIDTKKMQKELLLEGDSVTLVGLNGKWHGIISSGQDAGMYKKVTLGEVRADMDAQIALHERRIRELQAPEWAAGFRREGFNAAIEELEKTVKEYRNPYPQNIFLWKNKEKLDFDRGRFNEFTHNVVENTRQDVLRELQQMREQVKAGADR